MWRVRQAKGQEGQRKALDTGRPGTYWVIVKVSNSPELRGEGSRFWRSEVTVFAARRSTVCKLCIEMMWVAGSLRAMPQTRQSTIR